MKAINSFSSIDDLVVVITDTNSYFQKQVQKQVNIALTLRNWLFGLYIVEYELHGLDRAKYGQMLFKNLAIKLKEKNIKGLSFTNLHLCKQFYQTYPQIIQTVSEQLHELDLQGVAIIQTVSEQLQTDPNQIINRLIFTPKQVSS